MARSIAIIFLIVLFGCDNKSQNSKGVSESVIVSDSFQQRELKQVTEKISDAKIKKFYIFNYKKGALKKILGLDVTKIIVMNSAGKKLFRNSSWFKDNSFARWEFNPDSLMATDALETLCRNRDCSEGYNDDILYILWDGLELSSG